MKNLTILVIALMLPLNGCIPYLAGVIATSRSNSQARQNCAELGGEWIDGSSWGWSVGRCLMPNERVNLDKMSPDERCAFFGGTYANGTCKYTPEQECANLEGVYYPSTGACDLRNVESKTASKQPSVDKDKNTVSSEDCANLGGIYYPSTGACDLRYTEKEPKE